MLELQRTVYVLRRWWWLLLGAAIVGGLIAYLLTKTLTTPQYQSTAIVSMAPSSGPISMFAASADAALVPTLATTEAARAMVPGVPASQLSGRIDSSASVEGELLYITVRWAEPTHAPALANAVARTFIRQERQRLGTRYAILHQKYAATEQHLQKLSRSMLGSGPAREWLQSQYAASVATIYQKDADAQAQAAVQETSLQIAQPATAAARVGSRANLNAVLGAVLALLLALVFAFVATSSYGETADVTVARPVLSKVGD